MNWNPAYSQARIPDHERPNAPPHWLTLAQPVPPEQGRTRVDGVRIAGLHARGAAVAFQVDAMAEAPLRHFHFSGLDIEAHRGGHLQDVQGWRFDADCRLRLGTPIAMGGHCELAGLAADCQRLDPGLRRRDVSDLPMAEQDVL